MSIQIGITGIPSVSSERLRLYSQNESPLIDLNSSTSNVFVQYGEFTMGQSNLDSNIKSFFITSNNAAIVKVDSEQLEVLSKSVNFKGASITMESLGASVSSSGSVFTCNIEVYVDPSVDLSSNVFTIFQNIADENILSLNAAGDLTLIGNIGIGTFPSYGLHVVQDGYFQSNLYASNIVTSSIQNETSNLGINFDKISDRVIINGNTFINGTFDAEVVEFQNFFSSNIALNYFRQSNIDGFEPSFHLYVYSPDTSYNQNIMEVDIHFNDDPVMKHHALYMNNFGMVGVGTSRPTHLFHIDLNENFQQLSQNSDSDLGIFKVQNTDHSGGLFVMNCNVHIGIGTGYPYAPVHIYVTPQTMIDNDSIILFEAQNFSESIALVTSKLDDTINLRIGSDGVVHAATLQSLDARFDTINPFMKTEIWFNSNELSGIKSLNASNIVTNQISVYKANIENLTAQNFDFSSIGLTLDNDNSFANINLDKFAMSGKASLFYYSQDPSQVLNTMQIQQNNIDIQGTVIIKVAEPNTEHSGFTFKEYARGLVIDGTYENLDPGQSFYNKSIAMSLIAAERGVAMIELLSPVDRDDISEFPNIGELGYLNTTSPTIFLGFRANEEFDTKTMTLTKRAAGNNAVSFNGSTVYVNIPNELIPVNETRSLLVKGVSLFVSSVNDPVMIIDGGTSVGNIGIHTTAPTHTLHVNGDVRITDTLVLDTGSSATFNGTIDGITNFTSNMNVNGTIYSRGHVSTTSDRNLKINLETITEPLEKVQQMTGYVYNRIDRAGERETGLVAQEVQTVLPEVVFQQGDHLSIAYGNMAGLFVESIKALSSKVEALQKEIEMLKSPSRS